MKRFWLLFSQTATVALAVYFVLVTLKPQWFERRPSLTSTAVSVFEASPDNRSTAVQASSFSTAAKRAAPAVVSITTSKAQAPQLNDPWFRFFYGDQASGQPQTGLGSGVIVSPEGFILTNNHVVEEADQIEVQLSDGRRAQARVIGTDPETDLAILKVELDNLPTIIIGQSDQLEVGDVVLAIGNPFGVGQTVTSGIVSALGRSQLGINTFENFIQTDAAINPGNSGGALVDVEGNLVGINTAIYSRSGGSMGIGFAIPMSTARNVLEAIVKDGSVTRGWIGVEPQDLTPELAQYFGIDQDRGVIITGVLQNGPAAAAGIRPGDIILSVGKQPVHEVSSLLTAVAGLKPGQATEVDVLRGKEQQTLKVIPGRRTPPPASERR